MGGLKKTETGRCLVSSIQLATPTTSTPTPTTIPATAPRLEGLDGTSIGETAPALLKHSLSLHDLRAYHHDVICPWLQELTCASFAMYMDGTFTCAVCCFEKPLDLLGPEGPCQCLICHSCMSLSAAKVWHRRTADLQINKASPGKHVPKQAQPCPPI